MSFLDTDQGSKLIKQYLKKFDGGSQKVYKSEIQQFFEFKNIGIRNINKKTLHAYQENIKMRHSYRTTKRKFSILNGFFKFLERKIKDFKNPVASLKEFKTHRGVENEELKKYLEDFLGLQHRFNTRRIYENQIKLFFQWLGKDFQEINRTDILAYRDYLRENNYKDTTIWNKFISLNRFFKFIERENRKFHNPVFFKELSLIFPQKDRGYYTVLSKTEALRFLEQPDRRSKIGKRDYTILLLMLVYGLRVNEIANLRYKNLEPERIKDQQKVWIVDRKGRYQNRPKTAIILNGKSLRAFDRWLDVVAKNGVIMTGDMPIFLPFIYDRVEKQLIIRKDRLSYPLSVMAIENIVKKYLNMAKVHKEIVTLSPHALRHTAFTMLAQAGRPIQDIQKLAGHQDINTTMIYIHSVQNYDDHPGMYNPLNN
ncbi:MAG: integrase family protein [Candidatus Scalindua rubra]|uniref:Integrase family protein n=1 Tax=Candidatus Scalindua rubra TaxID=1872076 RepID=A0A1E3XD44_9BACT|nr:MAG: integrase family protein [Candidatus Scalindua rubra]